MTGCALVYPRPLSSAPPGTEDRSFRGLTVVGLTCAWEMICDVARCGVDRGWEDAGCEEDWVGFEVEDAVVLGGGVWGAAFGVAGTVDTERSNARDCRSGALREANGIDELIVFIVAAAVCEFRMLACSRDRRQLEQIMVVGVLQRRASA